MSTDSTDLPRKIMEEKRLNYKNSLPMTLYLFSFIMILAIATILCVFLIDNRNQLLINRNNGLVNQTYTRTTTCITSVSPTLRTSEYVKSCYNLAEQSTGTKVQHYGDGK